MLKQYVKNSTEENKLLLDVANADIDLHNIRIEIISQKKCICRYLHIL